MYIIRTNETSESERTGGGGRWRLRTWIAGSRARAGHSKFPPRRADDDRSERVDRCRGEDTWAFRKSRNGEHRARGKAPTLPPFLLFFSPQLETIFATFHLDRSIFSASHDRKIARNLSPLGPLFFHAGQQRSMPHNCEIILRCFDERRSAFRSGLSIP